MNEGSDHTKNGISIFEPIQDLEHDYLGRFQFSQRLLDRISEVDCPTTIGLYGGWGVGKTSILNMVIELNEQQNIPIVEKPIIEYIDVWPYEVSGDIAIPVLVKTRKLIGPTPPANYSKSWRRILGVLVQAGVDIALRRALDLELGDVKNYADNLKDISPDQMNIRDLETLIDDIQGAQRAYNDVVQLARKSNQNRRLVFLIDNLDRCSPENVVRLLESVKNFLYAPNCVWIFAMDSGVIASYIDRKYNGTRMDGNSYLDKIIPEQFHIPPVSGKELEKLDHFLSMAKPISQAGLPAIDLTKIPQLPEVLIPRRLLKTAHKFYRVYSLETDLGNPGNPDLVFSLILLYNTWPTFYERFSSESTTHVRGILANFIPKEEHSQYLIPIPKDYLDDRSLAHYVNACFMKGQDMDSIQDLLVGSMVWLRGVGLP